MNLKDEFNFISARQKLIEQRAEERKTSKVILEGLSPKQAEAFVEWFQNQGKRHCNIFLEVQNIPVLEVQKNGMIEVHQEGDVIETVFCKAPPTK